MMLSSHTCCLSDSSPFPLSAYCSYHIYILSPTLPRTHRCLTLISCFLSCHTDNMYYYNPIHLLWAKLHFQLSAVLFHHIHSLLSPVPTLLQFDFLPSYSCMYSSDLNYFSSLSPIRLCYMYTRLLCSILSPLSVFHLHYTYTLRLLFRNLLLSVCPICHMYMTLSVLCLFLLFVYNFSCFRLRHNYMYSEYSLGFLFSYSHSRHRCILSLPFLVWLISEDYSCCMH